MDNPRTTLPHAPRPRTGEPVRARGTFVCIALSLALGLVSLAWVPTILDQLDSMNPGSNRVERERRAGIRDGALQAQHRGLVAYQALRLVFEKRVKVFPLDSFERVDPDNGLYAHLALLSRFRSAHASAPAGTEWSEVLGDVQRAEAAPPARLYHSAMRKEVNAALLRAGVDPREAGVESLRMFAVIGERHRPVVRELADRLQQLGERLAKAGKPAEALRTSALSARMLLELEEDSPTYDVSLLAAERLPAALGQMAEAADRLGRASLAEKTRAAQKSVASFAADWHAAATDDMNVVPFSGNVIADLANTSQKQLLSSLTRTGMIAASFLLLSGVLLVLGIVVALRPVARSMELRWRGQLGAPLGTLIVLLPLVGLLVLPLGTGIPFTWLFTLKSGVALVRFLPVSLLALALAARVSVRLPQELEATRVPSRGMWILLVVCAALVVAAHQLVPTVPDARHAPAAMQNLRKCLSFSGLTSLLAVLVWFIWGQIRRRRAGLPIGLIARTHIAVAAQGLLVVSAMMPLIFITNARRDQAHRTIYAAACEEPVGDRLGHGWQERYFSPTRSVLTALSSSTAP